MVSWPAVSKWILGHRVEISGLCLVLVGVIATGFTLPRVTRWFYEHPYFRISTVHVEGNRRLSRAEILAAAGLHPGGSVWLASERRVNRRLREHPWIRDAQLERDFPHRVRITVEEREPAAVALLPELHYVDIRGRLLGPLGAESGEDHPLITGLQELRDRGSVATSLRKATAVLRRLRDHAILHSISEIHLTPRGVDIYPRDQKVVVHLGEGNWRRKLEQVNKVFEDWGSESSRLASIDFSFKDIVVVRARDAEAGNEAPRAKDPSRTRKVKI